MLKNHINPPQKSRFFCFWRSRILSMEAGDDRELGARDYRAFDNM